MPTEVHQTQIERFVKRGFSTRRFHKSLASALIGRSCDKKCVCDKHVDGWNELDDEDRECQWRVALQEVRDEFPGYPDAFHIDEERDELVVVEVEVSHQVDKERFYALRRLFILIDAYDPWGLHLIICDRFGNERVFDVMDICHEAGVPLYGS